MGQPEIIRSGNISVGANTPPGTVDTPANQPEESFGPVPEENQTGRRRSGQDPDRPFAKFAARFRRRRGRPTKKTPGRHVRGA